MKAEIHPKYRPARATCACGSTFVTRATVPEVRVDICSQCHPFYTGRQKIVDTEGRVERFQQRYVRYQQQADEAKAKQTKSPAMAKARAARAGAAKTAKR
jgi:large subunit ribosomal protein L31